MYLLDTNVWSKLLSGRSPAVNARVREVVSRDPSLLLSCSIVRAELVFGAVKSGLPGKVSQLEDLLADYASLSFDDTCSTAYAEIRGALEKIGQPIGANDLLIAAIALTHDLTVVTHNVGEFSRVPGLRVEDWQAD